MNTDLISLERVKSEKRASGCAAAPARANFVAQLIAMSNKAPQTRARRRAEPDEAIAAYDALSHPVAARPGDVLKRTL